MWVCETQSAIPTARKGNNDGYIMIHVETPKDNSYRKFQILIQAHAAVGLTCRQNVMFLLVRVVSVAGRHAKSSTHLKKGGDGGG